MSLRGAMVLAATSFVAECALAQASGSSTVTLVQLLEAVHKSSHSVSSAAQTTAMAEARTDAARHPGSKLRAEVEAAAGTAARDGEPRQNSGQFLLAKTFQFGRDDGALLRQGQAEAQAEWLEVRSSFLEQDLSVALTFAELRYHQRVAAFSKSILTTLGPLVEGAEQASGGGSTALAHLKWRLLQERLKATNTSSQTSFRELAGTLNQQFGASLPPEAAAAALEAMPEVASGTPFSSPTVLAHEAREVAARESVLAGASVTEVDGAVGIERDFTGNANALLVRLSVPLDQGSVNSARNRLMVAEQALVAEKARAARRLEAQRLAKLTAVRQAKRQEVEARTHYRDGIERLAKKGVDGMRRGLSELSEVIESLEQAFEANSELAKSQMELDEVLAELHLLAGGSHE